MGERELKQRLIELGIQFDVDKIDLQRRAFDGFLDCYPLRKLDTAHILVKIVVHLQVDNAIRTEHLLAADLEIAAIDPDPLQQMAVRFARIDKAEHIKALAAFGHLLERADDPGFGQIRTNIDEQGLHHVMRTQLEQGIVALAFDPAVVGAVVKLALRWNRQPELLSVSRHIEGRHQAKCGDSVHPNQ